MGWIVFLNQKDAIREKIDFYLAQVAMQVQKSVLTSEDARKVKLKDFLLDFKSPEELSRAEHARQVGAMWAAVLGPLTKRKGRK